MGGHAVGASSNDDNQVGSIADTRCATCMPGQSFSTGYNSPQCTLVTPCRVGEYETVAGTAVSDRQCGACTNKPAHAHYIGVGNPGANDCAFDCDESDGYALTNAGTECSLKKSSLSFKESGVRTNIQMHENGVVSFNNFKCMDTPEFCGDPL